jgi:hypothetical protein
MTLLKRTKGWDICNSTEAPNFPSIGASSQWVKEYFYLQSLDADSNKAFRQVPRTSKVLQVLLHKFLIAMTINLLKGARSHEETLKI